MYGSCWTAQVKDELAKAAKATGWARGRRRPSERSGGSAADEAGAAAVIKKRKQTKTEVEKTALELDMVQRQLQKITKKTSDQAWSVEDWLQSLQLQGNHAMALQTSSTSVKTSTILGLIGQALEEHRMEEETNTFEYVKGLTQKDIERALFSQSLHGLLVSTIVSGVKELDLQEEATAKQLSDKFKNDESSLTFSFGGLSIHAGAQIPDCLLPAVSPVLTSPAFEPTRGQTPSLGD